MFVRLPREHRVGINLSRVRSRQLLCPQAPGRHGLAGHRRWNFQYTPTSCFWMNAVEDFFGKLARRRLRCGAYDSIKDLKKSILDFIELHNEKEAKPFKWKADPVRLVASCQIGYQRLRLTTRKPSELCALRSDDQRTLRRLFN